MKVFDLFCVVAVVLFVIWAVVDVVKDQPKENKITIYLPGVVPDDQPYPLDDR